MILKDGSMKAVMLATSINFALKSIEEQESVIFQFQNFLNSLDFQVQIYVQSRKLDIRPYIALLEERQKAQTNDLMKIQISEYIMFVKGLTEDSNIMTKSFFLVVPYSRSSNPNKNILNVFGKNKDNDKNDEFEEIKNQLEQRVSVVEQGLARCGVRIARLGSEELVELFYRIFNPGDAEKPIKM